MKRLVLFLVACGSPVAPVHPADPSPPVRATLSCPTAAHAFETMRSLSDEVGPRLAGGPGDARAVAWAVKALSAAGLANVRAEPVEVPVWQRVSESAVIVDPPLTLAAAALGGSVATPEGGVVGEVVRFSSLEELGAAPDMRGKIAFVDKPTVRAADGHGYGESVGVRVAGASLASKKGAAAIVIRSIGTEHSRFPHTGVLRYEDGVPPIPAAALSTDDADLLTRALALHRVELKLSLETRTLPPASSANVIGEVPGELPDIVLLGAHLDSWDLGRGAIDDGAGVGIVIAAAEGVRARGKPRRTVRVVLFAAEENSGAGSKAYAKAHASENHAAALESDFGAGAAYAVRTLGATDRASMARALLTGIPGIDVRKDDAEGGADIGALRALGVPVIDVMQDGSAYFDTHHTAADVPEAADPAAMGQASCVVSEVAWRVSNAPADFGRVDEARRKRKW